MIRNSLFRFKTASFLLISITLAFFIFKCEKEETTLSANNVSAPKVITEEASSILCSVAQCEAFIISEDYGLINKYGLCWSTSPKPTISDNTTYDTTETYHFTHTIPELKCYTKYYVRAYVMMNNEIFYGNEISFNTVGCFGILEDIDGNEYNFREIGTQNWMLENLKVTHYRNGDPIPHVSNIEDWPEINFGAYCYYGNDTVNAKIYGLLYNWYAVNDPRGLAPEGWHVPSEAEWQTLIDNLGGESIAGVHLKASGYWPVADNSSMFSALPGGWHYCDLFYNGFGPPPPPSASVEIGLIALFSSNTVINGHIASLGIHAGRTNTEFHTSDSVDGLSVRCIRD
jgi:uncharacterized protein (TIGR02145 family)